MKIKLNSTTAPIPSPETFQKVPERVRSGAPLCGIERSGAAAFVNKLASALLCVYSPRLVLIILWSVTGAKIPSQTMAGGQIHTHTHTH